MHCSDMHPHFGRGIDFLLPIFGSVYWSCLLPLTEWVSAAGPAWLRRANAAGEHTTSKQTTYIISEAAVWL